MCSYYYFSRQYQNAVKIKSLYLTHSACYLTSNTLNVVQQNQISILISTEYFYIAELVQIPVLTAHYGEPPYKTCLYGDAPKCARASFKTLMSASYSDTGGKNTVHLPATIQI